MILDLYRQGISVSVIARRVRARSQDGAQVSRLRPGAAGVRSSQTQDAVEELKQTLVYVLRFDGRKRHHQADAFMVQIAAAGVAAPTARQI